MRPYLKYLIIIILVIVALAAGFLYKIGFIWTPDSLLKPMPAPNITEKIKGYWSSEGGRAFSELDDAQEMKKIGINTITFSPMLSHDQEGRVSEFLGSESYVKKTINKAHKAGLRVMLETTPMNAGAVDPKVTNPGLFQDEMTKLALKYAKIAEDYNVEYFAPIVEPGHHMSMEEADRWLQELLPKLKKVYGNKIMWKKQSNDLDYSKPWNQDHIFNLGFRIDGTEAKIQLKQLVEHSVTLNISSYRVSLEEHSKESSKFSETKEHSLSAGYHNLKIEIKGNLITIFIDNEKLIEKTDDSGPLGGYVISGAMHINQLNIADLGGKVLYNESFQNLNSFSAQSGLRMEGGEVIISPNTEAKLIHDTDFSGYDYIAIDTFHRGRVFTIDEYINFLKYYIQKTQDQAQADGVPRVILAEFGGSTKENIGWKDVDER
ncbi:hypothetical protein HYW31_01180, partial [Candidatus Berkelbacteria bacterium]|nr:hypothetical protein [Candidatus Berkelbacteria bacterium]